VLIEEPKSPEDLTLRVGDSWRQLIDNEEGFRSASCNISGDRAYLREWFETGLGKHWRTEDLYGNTVWEGMVWALSLVDEGWQQSRSLDTFGNRLRVLYDSTVTGERLHAPGTTTWYEDTDSQAIYGIAEVIQTAGATDATGAGGLGALELDRLAWPGRSKQKSEAGGTTLSIQLRGYMSTLAWRIYNDTTGGTANSSAMVTKIVTAVGQFISSTTVETNVFPFEDYHNRDRYALSILRDLLSRGDGTDPWTMGVYEDRVLRYEAVATDVNMLWLENQPTPVRLDGSQVYPWLVRPNDVIRTPWIVPGYTLNENPNRDPTVMTVKEASFSSPYTVSLIGTDDERVEILLTRIQKTRW
jgi:hypothetical protein